MYKIIKKDVHRLFSRTKPYIMKISLTTISCFLVCLQISATALAQKVTLKNKSITLKEAFREVNKQTGYHYLWSAKRVNSNTRIAIDIKNMELDQAIRQIIHGLQLSYKIQGKLITIRERENTPTVSNLAQIDDNGQQETITVRGRVVDSLARPLIGVTIRVISANKHVIKDSKSDSHGEIIIESVPKQSFLEISLLGYRRLNLAATENIGTIRMDVLAESLEELVVVGYLTKRASEVTGAVQSVKGEELRNSVSTPNVLSMLKGKTTGLYITESTGESGAKGQVIARGQSSMTTPTNNYLGPLIVVDGVITNYQSLQDAVNPADIEDISVLKDAASTAIYGSRAAQGVIVVTTKRGQAGKSTVEARVQAGVIQPVRHIRFMNTTELIDFMDTQMKRYWEQTPSIRTTFPNVADFIRERRVYTDEDRTRNFNWEDKIYSNGNFTNTEVGVRHGTHKTKFYMGVGWFKENGALYDNGFDRKNIRFNIDHAISSKLLARINVSSIIDRITKRNGVPELYMIQPFMYPYDNAGNLLDSLPVRQSSNYGPAYTTWTQNFLAETGYDNTKLTKVQNHLASISLRYNILPFLSFQTSNSLNFVGTNVNSYLDPRSFSGKYGGYPYLFSPTSAVLPNGTLEIDDTKFVDYLMSNTLNFNKTVGGNHVISALVGQEWGKRTTEIMDIDMYNVLPSERNMGAAQNFGSVINVAYGFPYKPSGNYQERATFSVFGQADYSYAGRYMASISVRTDATTNFGRDKRYGTFYSFSGGWNISKESFFKNIKVIDNLRLRASYGTSGRDLGDGYLNTTFYSETARYEQVDNIGAVITQLANPMISWETLHNSNIGLDIALLKNRINLSADIYHKRSDGLLQQVSLPSAQGALTQYQNVGQIVNRGIEVSLSTHNVKSAHFNWHTSFNFSYNKNKLTRLYQDSLLDSYSRSYYRKIGEDINVIKAIQFAGINPENGNMQHYNFDEKGNQIIVEGIGQVSNLANWQRVGQATPRFFGGFTNSFQYKNYSLNVEWWFQVGNYTQMSLVNNFQAPTAPRLGRNNVVFADNQHVWQGPGDMQANYPDVFSTDPNAWTALTYRSSKMWGNASHARLRNVRFTYSLPNGVLKALKLARADVFVSGDNLYVIKHKDFVGVDPEGAVLGGVNTSYGGAGTGFANPRRFLLGMQLTF